MRQSQSLKQWLWTVQEPKTPTSANVPAAKSHASPVLHTVTPIGIRQSALPAPDPAAVDVTVQLCPMVMSLVWSGLQLPMMAPVAHIDYHESSQRKEKVSSLTREATFAEESIAASTFLEAVCLPAFISEQSEGCWHQPFW